MTTREKYEFQMKCLMVNAYSKKATECREKADWFAYDYWIQLYFFASARLYHQIEQSKGIKFSP